MTQMTKPHRRRRRPEVDPCEFDMRFAVATPTFSPDPSEYVTEVTGRICLADYSLEGGYTTRCVGRIALTRYDLARALDDGQDPMEVFDCVSQSALDLYQGLYDGQWVRPEVERALEPGGLVSPSLLVVEAVEVLPAYRGGNLGLAATLKAMHVLGPEGGFAALMAAPLRCPFGKDRDVARWRRRMGMDAFPPDSPAVRATLGGYWGRLGFKPVGPAPADYYVRSLSVCLPTVARAMGGWRHPGGTENGSENGAG